MSRATAACSGMAAESGAPASAWQAPFPLPLREREGPARGEGAASTSKKRHQPPHLPIAPQWVPSSPARGEEIRLLRPGEPPVRAVERRRDVGHEALHLLLDHLMRLQP